MRTWLMSTGMLVLVLGALGCGNNSPSPPPADSGTDVGIQDTGGGTDTGGVTDTGGSTDAGADGGGMSTDGGAAPTWTTIYTTIIANRCSPCHTTNSSGALSMSSASVAYMNLVGRPAMGPACSGMGQRVVAGDANMSLLFRKVSPTPPCGSRMPQNQAPLSESEINMIRDWINAGALNN